MAKIVDWDINNVEVGSDESDGDVLYMLALQTDTDSDYEQFVLNRWYPISFDLFNEVQELMENCSDCILSYCTAFRCRGNTTCCTTADYYFMWNTDGIFIISNGDVVLLMDGGGKLYCCNRIKVDIFISSVFARVIEEFPEYW